MRRRILSVTVLMMFLAGFLPPKAIPCVGRILSLGVANIEDQKVMAEMLATMIGESTGTKVNIVQFKTLDECREAIKKQELDLYVDYVCSGLLTVLGGEKARIETPDKAYSTVKHLSDKRFSLIWLKPFGYDNPAILPHVPEELKGIPNQAVCVARRDVLNRFPVLPRLINKLGGKVSNEAIGELKQKKELKVAVKAFLEERKLIRWAI
ncbi:MAG: glycine betaine ABC transporter substrate-binding protein [bacterium]